MSFELFDERQSESNNYDLDFNPQYHIQDVNPKPHMALFPNNIIIHIILKFCSLFKETFLHYIVSPPQSLKKKMKTSSFVFLLVVITLSFALASSGKQSSLLLSFIFVLCGLITYV